MLQLVFWALSRIIKILITIITTPINAAISGIMAAFSIPARVFDTLAVIFGYVNALGLMGPLSLFLSIFSFDKILQFTVGLYKGIINIIKGD